MKTNIINLGILIAVMFLFSAQGMGQESLYQKAENESIGEEFKPPFHDGDPQRLKKHDLVTVMIRDSLKTSDSMSTRSNRENELGLEMKTGLKTSGTGLLFNPRTAEDADDVSFEMKSSKENMANGNAKRDTVFQARLTAEVVEVLPNGNVVLEGTKEIVRDDEIHRVSFSGIARQEDVNLDNTIYSERIANMKLRFEPEGAISAAGKRGWASKILDFLWPF